eukprot:5835916-Pyramimonas_sp.AAC.2
MGLLGHWGAPPRVSSPPKVVSRVSACVGACALGPLLPSRVSDVQANPESRHAWCGGRKNG